MRDDGIKLADRMTDHDVKLDREINAINTLLAKEKGDLLRCECPSIFPPLLMHPSPSPHAPAIYLSHPRPPKAQSHHRSALLPSFSLPRRCRRHHGGVWKSWPCRDQADDVTM